MLNKNIKLVNKITNEKSKRNHGLDLLKIIGMINIINLHINLRMNSLRMNSKDLKFHQVYSLEVFSFWPVDAFGLISGIVGYGKYKFSNIIYLWFIYIFYSIFFSIIPFNKSKINSKELILSFFPLGIKRNWYVNAYIFMYYFLPFITNSIHSINKNLFDKIVLHFFLIYSVYDTMIDTYTRNINFDFIYKGYSSLWLLILYIVGGYLRRFYLQKNCISIFLLTYVISSFITSEYMIYNIRIYNKQMFKIMSYTSPTIIIQALSLIFFFSNLKINNKYLIKAISFIIPLNFSTILIHMRYFFSKIQSSLEVFKFINSLSPKLLFFKIYGISISIYFICIIFDYFRYLLFKLFRIKNVCNFIEKIIF